MKITYLVQMIIVIAEVTPKYLFFAIWPWSQCQNTIVPMIKTSLAPQMHGQPLYKIAVMNALSYCIL